MWKYHFYFQKIDSPPPSPHHTLRTFWRYAPRPRAQLMSTPLFLKIPSPPHGNFSAGECYQQKPNNRAIFLPIINGSQAQRVRLLDFWPSKGTTYFLEQNHVKTYNKRMRLYFGENIPKTQKFTSITHAYMIETYHICFSRNVSQ